MQNAKLVVGVESNGTWRSTFNAGSDCGTVDQRPFALAYEQSSGRAVLAYRSGSSNTLRYRIWDGASWSAEATAPSALAGRPVFVKLVPRPGTNSLMLIALDDARSLSAMVWDGSAFSAKTVLETNTGSASAECFDAVFESVSGQCLAVWSQQSSSALKYARWNGSAWTAPAAAFDPGAVGLWVRLAADPISNLVVAGATDASSRLSASAWSGSAWGSNQLIESAVPTTGSRCFDTAFEAIGGRAVMLYARTGSSAPRYRLFDGSTWSAFATAPALPNPALLVQLTPSGGGREIMALANAAGGQNSLEFLRWNGSGFVNYQQLEPNVSGPSGAEVFMIPDEPPVLIPLLVSTWSESEP